MKKVEYKRCPRCELNFIKKNEKLCSVCEAELSAKDYVSDLDLELCPICKTNYIQPGEIMCSTCLKEHQNEDGELSSDWEQYINREEDDDYIDPDEETGDMASISDDPDGILGTSYDDDMEEFDDDDDLEIPEGIDDDDLEEDDDEEEEDEEYEGDDEDDDF